ncbi:hypothetical protein ACFX12_011140 [Malus domestica]
MRLTFFSSDSEELPLKCSWPLRNHLLRNFFGYMGGRVKVNLFYKRNIPTWIMDSGSHRRSEGMFLLVDEEALPASANGGLTALELC